MKRPRTTKAIAKLLTANGYVESQWKSEECETSKGWQWHKDGKLIIAAYDRFNTACFAFDHLDNPIEFNSKWGKGL